MRNLLANLVGIGTAGGALALGLVLGAPEASAGGPANPLQLANPQSPDDASSEVQLGESMQIWGQPSRLTMFWTSDDSEEIVRTYVEAWKGVGDREPLVRKVDKITNVSVLEAETGLMRSVSVTDLGDQRLVVPSLTDVRAFPDMSVRAAPVPIPENARGYLSQVADDASAVSYHASYVAAMSPKTTLEFYRQELTKLGYEPHTGMVKSTPRAQVAEWVRGPETVDIVATPSEPGSDEVSFVVVEHSRAIPQEE